MAKKMAYTDKFGNSYTDSYWRIVQVNVGVADHTAFIVFYGYRDQSARSAGKESIGQKTYTISSTDFDTMYAAHLAPNGPNLMALVYQYATQTLDEVDPNDPENKVSFFYDATDDV